MSQQRTFNTKLVLKRHFGAKSGPKKKGSDCSKPLIHNAYLMGWLTGFEPATTGITILVTI